MFSPNCTEISVCNIHLNNEVYYSLNIKAILFTLFVKNESISVLFQQNYPKKSLNKVEDSFYHSKYYREHSYSSTSLQPFIFKKYNWILEIGNFIQLHNKQFGQVLSIFLLDNNVDNIYIDLIIFIRATSINDIRHEKEIICTSDIKENVPLQLIKHFLHV